MTLFVAGLVAGTICTTLALCLCRAASVGDDPGGWADLDSIRRHEELRRELGRCRR